MSSLSDEIRTLEEKEKVTGESAGDTREQVYRRMSRMYVGETGMFEERGKNVTAPLKTRQVQQVKSLPISVNYHL